VTTPDYSKAAMMRFLKTVVDQHLLNPNTAAGWRAACGVVFDGVADTDDVRKVDVPTAIKRYNNKHPGEVKGTVLAEYQRRVARVIADFQKYTDDPMSYKGRGKSPTDSTGKPRTRIPRTITPITGKLDVKLDDTKLVAYATHIPPKIGMTADFNMRPDFMAQVVVPRDMKAHEARRLCGYIMMLATDYEPTQL
jgi:hypothetical protein